MLVYVESSAAAKFVTSIQDSGVYESLVAIVDTADQGVSENFNIPSAVIKPNQAHDKAAARKQEKLFCSWGINIINALVHMEAVGFCRAVWEKDADGVEGLKAYFTMVGAEPGPTLALAAKKIDAEKFYLSLMQCKLVMKPEMFHPELDNSLAILGLPPLPKVIRNIEADERAYYDALDEVQALSNSPVPNGQQFGYDG